VLIALLLGGVGGWFLHDHAQPVAFHSVREVSPEYKFIAPFLYLEVPESTLPAYKSLKGDIANAIDTDIKTGKASDIGVYVRDMNSGQWTGINYTHTFSLASMLKVVTVMTVLHRAEVDPNTLPSHVTISAIAAQDMGPQAYYPPAHPLQAGMPYSVDDLFWHDIVDSDNRAENALESFIGINSIKETYTDLHLPVPPTTETDFDTPQEYSHLFRVLYGATYLSRENSQTFLDLLSRTTFTPGLVAGVPAGTTVAHKLGENFVPISSDKNAPVLKELHDCGIVYQNKNPYFICVTTKGDDFPTLAGVIKDISALTWKEMAQINANAS
jgi:beta-lactamase class A